jgi:excisionase family DNA binding protein
MESMMTARQVAELLGVHENWVYDQAASGELPSYKIGGTRRFDPDELRGWISEHREPDGHRQLPRRSTRRMAPAADRRGGQHEEPQSELEHPKRARRRRADPISNADGDLQPRLFEI